MRPFVPVAGCVLGLIACLSTLTARGAASNSIARVWNERALAAIRQDRPHPPAQARNYFSLSVCMYDAWAAYDPTAVGYIYKAKHTAPDIAAARSNAISYAAFRLLCERHVYSITASNTLVADTNLFVSLGYNPNNNTRDTSTPQGVGNSVYDAVSAWFKNDGSRQTNGVPYTTNQALVVAYPDYPVGQGGYTYINFPLATSQPGIDDGSGNGIVDINRWQRLYVVNAVDQNGFPLSGPIQSYLGAQWLGVRPFALTRTDSTKPYIDPGPPPYFGGATHANFRSNVVEVIRYGSQLTPDDGVVIDASPLSQGNNTLGANDGHGRTINPWTGLPYAPNLTKRGDFARALTEYWADGPNSETPPGHWNVIANDVSDNPLTVKKIGGVGPVVSDLEWDVKLYFALNAALHEAACAAWGIKRYYDGWRPMSAIRYMAGLGQSTDPGLPSYNANGLPLITNLIELVTSSSVASGRHAGLTPGKIATFSWPGETSQRVAPNGVHWIHGDTWTTYQRSNFVVPAFPGYVSGHSTFSRSAAEMMSAFTGTNFFPGGMGSYTITNLLNEKGPSQPVTLQWATYYDAGDQIGISRIWGGIHPPADDFAGRITGAQCGQGVWALAKKYFDGSVANHITLAITNLNGGSNVVSFNTLRGFTYKLQSKTDVSQTYGDEGTATTSFNADPIRRTNDSSGPLKIYRATGY